MTPGGPPCERVRPRSQRWPVVARRYAESFARARAQHAKRLRTSFQARTLAKRPAGLPEVNLEHLRLMTDDTGVLQHAMFSVPRYDDGYCLDDNARALLLMAVLEDAGTEDPHTVRGLASRTYRIALTRTAVIQKPHVVLPAWIEPCGSGAATVALTGRSGHRRPRQPSGDAKSRSLFAAALPAVSEFTSPRAWAFALLGIDEYLRAFQGDSGVQSLRKALAERLFDLYQRASAPDWPWFEERVTYCNARLSQALLVFGSWMEHEEMIRAGLRSLEWLVSIQRSAEGTSPPSAPTASTGEERHGRGSTSSRWRPVRWWRRVSRRPAEGDVRGAEARRVRLVPGAEPLQQALYGLDGGRRDGLHAIAPTESGEIDISFLLALVDMRSIERADVIHKAVSLEVTR
jgi:hypothetical protein